MPSFKIAGKSKEDLIVVAQLAGLISAEESAQITRPELVKILEKANRASTKAAETVPATPVRTPAARVRKTAAKPEAAMAEPVLEPELPVALPAVVKVKRIARPAKAVDKIEPVTEPELPVDIPAVVKVKRIARPAKAAKVEPVLEMPVETVLPIPETPAEPEPAPLIIDAEPPAPAKPARKTASRKAAAVEQVIEPPVVEPAIPSQEEAPVVSQTEPEGVAAPARLPRRKTIAVQPVAETPAAPEVKIEITPEPAAKPIRRKKTVLDEQPSAEPAAEAYPSAPAAVAAAESASDSSPEASEAASDKESFQERADLHRVPAHHTLKASRPAQRRTTRIIGDSIPADGRQDRIPDDQSEFSEDNAAQQPAEAETAAGSGALITPVQPGLETEAPKTHRPVVEAGDIQAGVLEIMPDGYGFLRKENYLQGTKDIYVPPQYIRRFGLRPGDYVTGPVKLQRESDRYQALLYIKDVNGMPPEKMLRRPHFDRLTPIYPDERFVLETVRNELSTRIIDLVAPIGRGQRGMIVSPPKAGKTILLQKIANAISTNNPDVKLIVLLIDERPEEVTDMQRSINGEVVYSTFDKTPENHTKVTELVLERAMRLVELKQDVVILLDSMTRLARAYNLTINPTGRTLSGGLDPGALYGPKRFFGAARNIENGGSLTIIATSLIETGSRMDEVIFEEFKGTGNMEVYLDRKMSEKRIFPAIDINKSGTRREELLMTTKELDAVWTIRKAFSQLDTTAVTEAIINLLLKTKNNEHFIASVNVSFNDKNVFEAMRGVRPGEPTQGPQNTRTSSHSNAGYSSNYRRQAGPEEE